MDGSAPAAEKAQACGVNNGIGGAETVTWPHHGELSSSRIAHVCQSMDAF